MANRIRKLREERVWTQADLAERLHVAVEQLARWERGKDALPSHVVRDAAVLFDRSASEVLGLKRLPPKGEQRKLYAGKELDLPYGAIRIRTTFGDLEYPVGEKARERILAQLDDEGLVRRTDDTRAWLQFETLNNRHLFVNLAFVRRVDMISDDDEAMPPFEHPEVYRAFEDWEHQAPEEICGPVVRAKCQALIDAIGDEAAVRASVAVRIVYRDGLEDWEDLLEEHDISGWTGLEMESYAVLPQTMLFVDNADYYRGSYINLDHVALVELPAERFARMSDAVVDWSGEEEAASAPPRLKLAATSDGTITAARRRTPTDLTVAASTPENSLTTR